MRGVTLSFEMQLRFNATDPHVDAELGRAHFL